MTFDWSETREWLNVLVAIGALLIGVVSFWTTARISGLEDYLRSEIGRRNIELNELSQRTQRMQGLSDLQSDQLAAIQTAGAQTAVTLQEAQLKLQGKQDLILRLTFEETKARGRIMEAENALTKLRTANDEQAKLVDLFRRDRVYEAVMLRAIGYFDIPEDINEISGETGWQKLLVEIKAAAQTKSELAPYFQELASTAPIMCKGLQSYRASFEPRPRHPEMPDRPGKRIDTETGPAIQFASSGLIPTFGARDGQRR
ncbi:MAG: hypothetical protein LKM31_07075 [Sphingobium sp.]|jgi:hypothetical protein|nr:hypothetical protein [Sphingobium sp.]